MCLRRLSLLRMGLILGGLGIVFFTQLSSADSGGYYDGNNEVFYEELPGETSKTLTAPKPSLDEPLPSCEKYIKQTLKKVLSCERASPEQLQRLQLGFSKKEFFLETCFHETNGSSLCEEIIQSNPNSRNYFDCTYPGVSHYTFVPPDDADWESAFIGINILESLRAQGIPHCHIYNWWRPEPYNRNVGGEAGRHPYGTAVDVRFPSARVQEQAFDVLCALKKEGEINALGFYYGTPSIHIGVRDNMTLDDLWGRSSCF